MGRGAGEYGISDKQNCTNSKLVSQMKTSPMCNISYMAQTGLYGPLLTLVSV